MQFTYSKADLEKLKVAELRQYAENYGLETAGLRKAELIEAILANQMTSTNEKDNNFEVVDEQLEEKIDANEQIEDASDTIHVATVNDAEQIENNQETIDIEFPYTLNLPKATMLYEKMDVNSSGIYPSKRTVEVLQEIDNWLYVECFISGLGYKTGYMIK